MTSLRNVLLISLLGVSSIAFGDSFDDAYDAGTALFTAKDYARARAEFLKAYDLRPEPIVLYNIAQTYRFENNVRQAIDYYKRYLADSKSAEALRKKSQDYIAELENAAKNADEDRKNFEANGPKNPDGTPATITEPPRANPGANKNNPATAHDEGERHRRIPLGSKIAAGVTGAGLISALVWSKLGLAAEKDLKNNANPTQADADEVERDQNLINISWGLTGAAALTAVVLYFATPSYATDRKTIVIAPNRDGGWAASFEGRF